MRGGNGETSLVGRFLGRSCKNNNIYIYIYELHGSVDHGGRRFNQSPYLPYTTMLQYFPDSKSAGLPGSFTDDLNERFADSGQYTTIEVSDYITLDEGEGSIEDGSVLVVSGQHQAMEFPVGSSSSSSMKREREVIRKMDEMEGGSIRIAFKTKSEIEILNDGFKWRKYGKKSVKNNPNPRNYYRCSSEGCSVKKRVERDREDHSYVITTYDGVHNHTTPGVVYYTAPQEHSRDGFLVGRCL